MFCCAVNMVDKSCDVFILCYEDVIENGLLLRSK